MIKFHFFALGCKVNLFESEALAQLAVQRGHEIVDKDADICILNSCTVTAVSNQKNIRAIHRLKKQHPRAMIVVTGCMAQIEPEILKNSGLVDVICGTSERAEILQRCETDWLSRRKTDNTDNFRKQTNEFEVLPSGVPRGRTRALLKIQDGCDNYCTYCIIPYARGHVRSLPISKAVEQAKELMQNGVHEIVLTGIEISSYGRDFNDKTDLVTLIDKVASAVPNVRIRLGSLEPRTVTEEFCNVLSKHKNLMPHFHLSLQSGCNSVLKRMKRKYKTEDFFIYVKRLKNTFKDCSITTDIIVGFPSETEDEFNETCRFVKKCGFSDMHVFPYSQRPGTIAAAMDGQIDNEEKQRRANKLKNIGKEMQKEYLSRFIGRELLVLWEHQDSNGRWCGHSEYSFQIKTLDSCKKNQFTYVKILEIEESWLNASVVLDRYI